MILLGEHTVQPNGLDRYLRRHHWGRMWARDPAKFETTKEICGFDNGAYSSWRAGKPFHANRLQRRLDAFLAQPTAVQRCLVAVTPDIPAQGAESLDFSMRWLDRLPSELPWYLAVQDGMGIAMVQEVIDYFAGIFLGGTNAFKQSANAWCKFAHENGKPFHYGRCSTVNRLRDAIAIGAESVDSALPVINWNMGDKKRARSKRWLDVASGDDRQLTFGF